MSFFRFISGVLCVVLLSPVAALGASSPADTVLAVQRAIDATDIASFEQHIDLDHLLKQTVSTFLDSLGASEQSAQAVELPPTVQALAQTAKNPQMREPLQALLISEARSFLLYGVASGHFAGKPDDTVAASGLLAPFLPRIAPGRKSLAVAGPARKDGRTRLMPVTVHDAGSDQSTRLELRFTERDGTWEISEIANLTKLLAALPADK